jgi:hypothetical protein
MKTPTGHAGTGAIQNHSLGADYPFTIVGIDTDVTIHQKRHFYRATLLTTGQTWPTRETYEEAHADIALMKLTREITKNCAESTPYRMGYITYTSGSRTGNPYTANESDYGMFGKGHYDALRLAGLEEATS